MKILYFTATGNSPYVAKKLGGQLLSIPQLVKAKVDEIEDDAVGVVCPVYCGELPRMVREFLLKAKVRTNYFFFVLTYGISSPFHTGLFYNSRIADKRRKNMAGDSKPVRRTL